MNEGRPWRLAGWDLHLLENAALSRRTPETDIGGRQLDKGPTDRTI